MSDDTSRPARVEDVHELALAMPHVTVEYGTDDHPVYQVGRRSFIFFRNPRPDAVDPTPGNAIRMAAQAAAGTIEVDRLAIAVDGKSLRGAVDADGKMVHLLAAMLHRHATVIAQRAVEAKTNEITGFAPLLDGIDIAGAIITADALHTQREHARYLHQREADDVLVVKDNQPTLFAQLDTLPWHSAPKHTTEEHGHGRVERRTIQVLPVPPRVAFPHAAQAWLVEHYVSNPDGSRHSAVAVLGITSLTDQRIDPPELAAVVRGQWEIETKFTGCAT